MPRPSGVPKTDPSPFRRPMREPAPASASRPRQPSPSADEQAERDAAEYARLRVEEEDLKARIKEQAERTGASMRRADRTRISTPEGTVALLDATSAKQVTDEKAALALLAAKGLDAPPTLEQWLGRNGFAVPTKPKEGLPERLAFTSNK
jgi:hypothetical protein